MGQIEVVKTKIDDVLILKPKIFEDARGYFFESYSKRDLEAIGITDEFVQDNQSKSSKNVLRGLHFQIKYPQAKLVRALKGKIFDVVVDIRKNSPTYGEWVGVELS